ncbi:hypothetical protein H072_3859 [Dactylellina haptotyla CBS 200.50]|uniref:Rhodopsin domain-containing protein n=1 Tax=Dactylellina haptotyla (strain CBS 200.50) TaxID=1284197 RepID=S8ALW3_DACHA|nr:hypothetical protein H072_3859 [Dactylellina haptotyla CBS 200.50]
MSLTPTEEAILKATNVDASVFGLLDNVCQAFSWLAQGEEWKKTKALDISLSMADFLNRPEITNKSLAAPQLAAYLGTTEERTQFLFDFFGDHVGIPFSDLIDMVNQVMPAAGHPANNSSQFIGVFVMFTVLMVAFLALRLYSRVRINGFVRGHDYVLLFAALVAFGYGAMNATMLNGPTHYQGNWDRSWEDYIDDSYSGKATEVLYPLGVFLIKTSLLLFYWGLTPWWPLRVAVGVTWVVSLGNSLTMIFTWVFRCNPVLSFDGYDYFTASCKTNMWLKSMDVTGALNIVTDVFIWLIPLPMVWKIAQGNRERLLASLTFGIGALACIATGFRFYSLHKILAPSLLPPDQSEWLIWGMAEMYIAIICSCVPAIRALIIKIAPSLIGSTTDVYSTSHDGKTDEKSEDKEKIGTNIHIHSSSDSNRGSSPV